MRRNRSPCCARAASGHAAAPPSIVMNVRRVMPSIGLPPSAKRRHGGRYRPAAERSDCRTISLAWGWTLKSLGRA
jgi:hypothetical protein